MTSRLKSLELQGYKTFASRAIFEFPGRITAVVGPNGAGKSNIADSARWVLGEQAYSLLRARKTEDMIFAGSDQRPKSGMASVTITFDNEDGWLPIDFNEVTLTRRAYRDGQNEYLLNGQKVRLKEINELLGSSGLSERTYTIIGQGLVDTALSLRPEERRKFFEEAAGIGLYRSRRDEAISRLDVTRRNLERAQDILSELTPRLGSLEKQARRAREFDQIQDGLHTLLREWYGFHWHRIQNEVLHQRMIVKAQEERLEQARDKTLTVESSMSEMRLNLNALREKIAVYHTQSAELHSSREHISRELAVFDERKKSLTNQLQGLQSEKIRLEEDYQASIQRMESLEKELVLLQDEVRQANSQLETEQVKLTDAQNTRKAIELKLAEARRALISHETARAQKKARLEELKLQLNRQLQQQNSLNRRINENEPALESAKKDLQDLQVHLQQIIADAEKAEKEHNTTRESIKQLEDARQKNLDETNRITTEIKGLNAQLDVVIQAEKALAGWGQGARSLIDSAKKGKLPGSYQTLVSQIRIPEKFEKAVSAAMGEYLEAIVVNDMELLDRTLVLIEQEKTNKVMLLLAENAEEVKSITAPSGEGILGRMIDLVQAPERLLSLVKQVFGNTIVVENRQSAYRMMKTASPALRMVTLTGEVFSGKNSVVAGESGQQALLARPRMIKDLSAQIEDLKSRELKSQEQLKSSEVKLADKRAAERKIQEDLNLIRKNREKHGQRIQEMTLQVNKLQQQADWLRNQETQNRSESEKAQALHAELTETLVQMDQEQAVLEQNQTAILHDLDTYALEELTEQVNFWRTSLAVAQKSLQDTQRRKLEYQNAIGNSNSRMQSVSARLETLQGEIRELETQRASALQQVEKISNDIAVLQLEIDPQEQQLRRSEEEYDTHLSNQMAVQQALSVAERYNSQAQIELARKNEELASLQRKVEDDFGLVAFQYNSEISGPTPLPLDEFVEQLPQVEQIKPELEDNINRQRALLKRMGAINPEAQQEYNEVKERHDLLVNQIADLRKADEDLRLVIQELDELMQREFRKTFEAVAAEFKHLFTRLFGGGSARLVLVEGEKLNEDGIDIEARLPGRREQGLALLSGGERSLTAVALIFSLLKVSPTPFCIMDEVDAMLDEANVGRFCELLQELSKGTQFIVITHNRNTVQIADVIYGVTMGRDSASQVISLRIDQLSEEMVK